MRAKVELKPDVYEGKIKPKGGEMLMKLPANRPSPWPDLHALQHVEEVIHARQVLHVLEDGHQQRGSDGNGAGQQHPSKTRPAQVQETLRTEKKHNVR